MPPFSFVLLFCFVLFCREARALRPYLFPACRPGCEHNLYISYISPPSHIFTYQDIVCTWYISRLRAWLTQKVAPEFWRRFTGAISGASGAGATTTTTTTTTTTGIVCHRQVVSAVGFMHDHLQRLERVTAQLSGMMVVAGDDDEMRGGAATSGSGPLDIDLKEIVTACVMRDAPDSYEEVMHGFLLTSFRCYQRRWRRERKAAKAASKGGGDDDDDEEEGNEDEDEEEEEEEESSSEEEEQGGDDDGADDEAAGCEC